MTDAELRTLRIEIRQMSKNIELIVKHLGIDKTSTSALAPREPVADTRNPVDRRYE